MLKIAFWVNVFLVLTWAYVFSPRPSGTVVSIPAQKSFIESQIESLKNDNVNIRLEAVMKLRSLVPERLPDIIQALKHPSEHVRAGVEMSLANRRAAPAVPGLIENLKDQNRVVRYWAAKALGQIGSKTALPALRRSQSDPDSSVGEAAQRAIEEIKKEKSQSEESRDWDDIFNNMLSAF